MREIKRKGVRVRLSLSTPPLSVPRPLEASPAGLASNMFAFTLFSFLALTAAHVHAHAGESVSSLLVT